MEFRDPKIESPGAGRNGVEKDAVDEADIALLADLFKVPEHYYETRDPSHEVSHQLSTGKTLQLGLVGKNPLWVQVYHFLLPLPLRFHCDCFMPNVLQVSRTFSCFGTKLQK